MHEDELNRLLFFTLDAIQKLGSPRISMWALNDKYASPPYLRFRFKDVPTNAPIYKTLGSIVATFKGNLPWEMIHDETKAHSYFILPQVFASLFFQDDFNFEKESFLRLQTETEYQNTIDKAIGDIANLATHITEQFQMKAVIDSINNRVKQSPFFDFYIFKCEKGNLVIAGGEDLTYYHEVEIGFSAVHTIICNTQFKADTSTDLIGIVENVNEAKSISLKYGVVQGNHIFKLRAEGNQTFYIVAENISFIEKIVKYY